MPASNEVLEMRLEVDLLKRAMMRAHLTAARVRKHLIDDQRRTSEVRQSILVAHVERLIPDLSRETLLSLITSDVRTFAGTEVQVIFNNAPLTSWRDRLISLVYFTDAYWKYHRYECEHLDLLREKLIVYLSARVETLARLEDITLLDIDLHILGTEIASVEGDMHETDKRYDTLSALQVILETREQLSDTVLRTRLDSALHLLDRTESEAPTRRDPKDPLVSWARGIPVTLAEWGVHTKSPTA